MKKIRNNEIKIKCVFNGSIAFFEFFKFVELIVTKLSGLTAERIKLKSNFLNLRKYNRNPFSVL